MKPCHVGGFFSMAHQLVKNLHPAIKCWAAKPHGCMVPCSCLAPSHPQARDGDPWGDLDRSWLWERVSQSGHDQPVWGSGTGRDLALALPKLHLKLLLDEPGPLPIYVLISQVPT